MNINELTKNDIPVLMLSGQASLVPEITPLFGLTFPFAFISKHSFPFRKLKNLQAGLSMHAEWHSSGVVILNGLKFLIHGPENSLLCSKHLFSMNLEN